MGERETMRRDETPVEAERRLVADSVLRLGAATARADGTATADETYNLEVYAESASTPKLRAQCRRALEETVAWRSLQEASKPSLSPSEISSASTGAQPPCASAQGQCPTYRLERAENGVWYFHWTEGRRTKRRSTRKRTLPEAQLVLDAYLADLRATQTAHDAGPTCGQLWTLYVRQHVARKCVNEEDHRTAWKALAPTFSALRPREVTQAFVDRHVADRWPVKPSSVRRELVLLVAAWNFGIKKRAIAAADVPGPADLELPRPPSARGRWFREPEIDRLFAAAAEDRPNGRLLRVERFIRLALETAGRRDALLELTWKQVDFEIRVVHLLPDGREQTSKRRASVPVSDALLSMLERAWNERCSDFVLDHPGRLHYQLDKLAERAGVPGATAHVFRHTAATCMARRGVPLWQIAKVLGNSVEQVERVYAKHCPDDLRDAVNAISGKPRPRAV